MSEVSDREWILQQLRLGPTTGYDLGLRCQDERGYFLTEYRTHISSLNKELHEEGEHIMSSPCRLAANGNTSRLYEIVEFDPAVHLKKAKRVVAELDRSEVDALLATSTRGGCLIERGGKLIIEWELPEFVADQVRAEL